MRKRLLVVLTVVFGAIWLLGCLDAEPAEIGVSAFKSGRQQGCTILMYNADGKQTDQVSTDFGGVGYIKNIKPGTYTLKFMDNQNNFYPAVKLVTVSAGGSHPVRVELTEPPADGVADPV
jgi:hypothetical protein